jgi:hypothetical protein
MHFLVLESIELHPDAGRAQAFRYARCHVVVPGFRASRCVASVEK